MTTPQSTKFYSKYKAAAAQAAAGTKVFPETILSVAAHESGYGKSLLASKYNNFFGIKADSSWTGKKIVFPTKEQDKSGNVFTVNAAFRWYDNAADSFRNYVKFISGPRYVKAGVLSAKNPADQFTALKKAGYATDVAYVNKLKDVLASFGNFVKDHPGTDLATIALFFCSLN